MKFVITCTGITINVDMSCHNQCIWLPGVIHWKFSFYQTNVKLELQVVELTSGQSQLIRLALYRYNINVINIRMVVYSIYIFSPRYIRSCFAHFWARSKSSKYLQQKHGIMAVKRKTIHDLVWQNLVPTYRRDINKFPKICLRKYFRLIGETYL